MDTYPDTFAFVQIHHGDSWPTSWGNARASFYDFGGYPTSYFGGVIERVGAWSYSTYAADYAARRAMTTWTTIELTAAFVGGRTYDVWATVCSEAGGSSGPLRIYMVEVLDHWPTTVSYSRNGFRQAVETQDITLPSATCQVIHRTFTFDATSWANQENIKIIAWAQEPQNTGGPSDRAQVFQAAIMPWPFAAQGLPGDFDGDEDVDEDDYDEFISCFTGSDGGPFGLGCAPGDFEWDGDIDCYDWLAFELEWTAPGAPPALEECAFFAVEPNLPEGEAGYDKNRYVAFAAGDDGKTQAIRVKFTSLPAPFDIWNGTDMWVQAPEEICSLGGTVDVGPCGSNPTFWAATLGCTPHYRSDWSDYEAIHTYHEGIVPSHMETTTGPIDVPAVYDVQVIDVSGDIGNPAAYSSALTITTAGWGDTVGAFNGTMWAAPDNSIDIADALGVLDRFGSSFGAPIKPRVDLEPACVDLLINITDTVYLLDAFGGHGYPFPPSSGGPCNQCSP